MSYESVDALQTAMADKVFKNSESPKKAAGRALGVIVELITFYMLRDWGLEPNLAIERGLPEYGNDLITHNVEFTLHPTIATVEAIVPNNGKNLTATQIIAALSDAEIDIKTTTPKKPAEYTRISNNLREGNKNYPDGNLIRHSTIFASKQESFWVASMVGESSKFVASHLENQPFAMFECKRVGVEKGMKKGPQTIEKAKQGAYVARSVSALQRIARSDGSVSAVVENAKGEIQYYENYYQFLRKAIDNRDENDLKNIVLTVGVVSNHGNWFDHTSGEHNKEIRVLAQSYDWLLFLTDRALAEFITDVAQGSDTRYAPIRAAFNASFGRASGKTSFTKVTIDEAADKALTEYFAEKQPWENWFNVIAPAPSVEAQAAVIDQTLEGEHGSAGTEVPAIALNELKKDLHALASMSKKEA